MKFKEFCSSHGWTLINTGGGCSALSKASFLITIINCPKSPSCIQDNCILSCQPEEKEAIVLKEGIARDLIICNPSKLIFLNQKGGIEKV